MFSTWWQTISICCNSCVKPWEWSVVCTKSSDYIRHTYISKHNSTSKNGMNFLMITMAKNSIILLWKISTLFKGIRSNHKGWSYCLNCLHSFRTANKPKKYGNVCKSHKYCYREMPQEDKSVLKYNHGEK